MNASVDLSSLLGMVGAPTTGCAPGYASEACRECAQPGYYRLGNQCPPCPKKAYTFIVAFSVVLRTFLELLDAKGGRGR